MSIASSGFSAIGRLGALGLFAGAFLFGLAGVVYMSLQGAEIQVPEITGKNLSEGEKELALLGLKIRKRADRVSAEAPGTVIEQIPKPGDTVKTGQWISVVISKGGGEANVPQSLKDATDEDDTEKIEEMISDKPKKPRANSNSRKKADTARDVNGNTASANSNSKPSSGDASSNKKDPATSDSPADKPNKNTPTPAGPKPANPGTKPPAGDSRPRTVPRP